MDKVETWVNILAAITSIFFSIVNYKFKVASKKSEEKAETSKKEILEIEKSVKEEVQRGIQEKARFHEYSSIETELKSMRTKLGTLEKRDEEINLSGITPESILQDIREGILSIREYKHLPGLSGFDFQTFDEKLIESETADYRQRVANVRYLKRMISTQISSVKENNNIY